MREWREVAGYEGLYLVSDDGFVKNEISGEILKMYISPTGYARVSLSGKVVSLHRIVANAFIPNLENKPCVNHKDGNKLNNSVNNLEWCSHSENERHSYRVLGKKISPELHRKMIEAHTEATRKSVTQCTLEGAKIRTFSSTAEAHRITGISQGNISECCNNKRKQAGGFKWNFEI